MIYNTQHSLCLEESAAMGEVLLRKCNLESESQQWIWIDQGMLMCAASFRCLSAIQRETPKTQPCREPSADPAGLMWDCDGDRLLSRNTSMLLSIDGQHLTLKHSDKNSKWRSQDEGGICQNKLSKLVKITETQKLSATLSLQSADRGHHWKKVLMAIFHIPSSGGCQRELSICIVEADSVKEIV